jgi:hypothetical protein
MDTVGFPLAARADRFCGAGLKHHRDVLSAQGDMAQGEPGIVWDQQLFKHREVSRKGSLVNPNLP